MNHQQSVAAHNAYMLKQFVACPKCGHQAKGRHLLGLLCRKCGNARLIPQDYDAPKPAPTRLNSPSDANSWPNQQGKKR